jgi:hypothetical protein
MWGTSAPQLFATQDESPIGAAIFYLGQGDADGIQEQIAPMPGAALPTAHRIAERFLPRSDVLRHDIRAVESPGEPPGGPCLIWTLSLLPTHKGLTSAGHTVFHLETGV